MSLDVALPVVAKPEKSLLACLAGASMVGTTLEWYDFTIYNTMAALIFNQVFFPSVDPIVGVTSAFRPMPLDKFHGLSAASRSVAVATRLAGVQKLLLKK